MALSKLVTPTLLLAGLTPLAVAQGVSVPSISASIEGNDITKQPFGTTDFRVQQVVDASAIANVHGVITSIMYRPDSGNSSGNPVGMVQNVTVKLGHTTATPLTMSTTFSANITGAEQTVFSGTVMIPPYTSTPGGQAPWQVMIPLTQHFVFDVAQGNLLIDITATDAAPSSTGFHPDSMLPGGSSVAFGTAAPLSSGDQIRTVVNGSGPSGRYSGMVPGGQLDLALMSQWTPYSGVLHLGFAELAQPLDMTFLGMPGSTLYVDSVASVPVALVPPMIGFGNNWTATIPLPNDPTLAGLQLFTQPMIQDAAANSTGWVLLEAQRTMIAENGSPLQQVTAQSSSDVIGKFAYVNGIVGGAVVYLDGYFN